MINYSRKIVSGDSLSNQHLEASKYLDLTNRISKFLDESKATNVITINLHNKSSIADFMLIATCTSSRHIKALSEKLKEFLFNNGLKNIKIEGLALCDWVLIDTGDVIIHLFRPETREFYNLEKMWSVEFTPTLSPYP